MMRTCEERDPRGWLGWSRLANPSLAIQKVFITPYLSYRPLLVRRVPYPVPSLSQTVVLSLLPVHGNQVAPLVKTVSVLVSQMSAQLCAVHVSSHFPSCCLPGSIIFSICHKLETRDFSAVRGLQDSPLPSCCFPPRQLLLDYFD